MRLLTRLPERHPVLALAGLPVFLQLSLPAAPSFPASEARPATDLDSSGPSQGARRRLPRAPPLRRHQTTSPRGESRDAALEGSVLPIQIARSYVKPQ